MNFSGVPIDQLSAVWERVEPYLSRACQRGGDFNASDILRSLLRDELQLWLAHEQDEIYAIVVTKITDTASRRVCTVLIGTGREREKWQEGMRLHLEAWARDGGCSLMRVIARPGWERVYTPYRKTHSILEHVL